MTVKFKFKIAIDLFLITHLHKNGGHKTSIDINMYTCTPFQAFVDNDCSFLTTDIACIINASTPLRRINVFHFDIRSRSISQKMKSKRSDSLYFNTMLLSSLFTQAYLLTTSPILCQH